jgi:serine/threonine-protein phosphatase 2A regulatory subunit B''
MELMNGANATNVRY